MNDSIYNLENQNSSLTSKIVVALEKISEAYRVMLWEKSKTYNLSPIQIQILVFVNSHKPEYCTVSYLAEEFNITKATVSDSVKSLLSKGYIQKLDNEKDTRSYLITLTKKGKELIENLNNYSKQMINPINDLDSTKQLELWENLSSIIQNISNSNLINMKRMCLTCKYYSSEGDEQYCELLEQELKQVDIRIDCPEHKTA